MYRRLAHGVIEGKYLTRRRRFTKKIISLKVDNVQRHFTKRITSISHSTYHERLSILDLESLELRCLRFDLIQYYKILKM